MPLKAYLSQLVSGCDLTYEHALDLSSMLMAESLNPVQVSGVLTALKTKGETYEEVAGFAMGLKENATVINVASNAFYDVVGTGGDGANTFNISTTTAFVLAGAGVPIAKHGNRSISSKCGSADVLEALGVTIDLPPQIIENALNEVGLAFIFAQRAHPSMRNVIQVRRDLGVPTIFNIVGPLANPVTLKGACIGVYKESLIDIMAESMVKMGMGRGAVIHGAGGLDEATLSGDNLVAFVKGNKIDKQKINGQDYGLLLAPVEALKGGNSLENATMVIEVLQGVKGPKRDVVLLNAGIALYAYELASSIEEGIEKSRISIDSGAALGKLNDLKRACRKGSV